MIPEFRQLVHGISLSHFTFRLVHLSQLNLAIEGICVCDTLRIKSGKGAVGIFKLLVTRSGDFQ